MKNLLREPYLHRHPAAAAGARPVLYGYCINFDLHNIPFAVWDQDRTEQSRRLAEDFNGGPADRTPSVTDFLLDLFRREKQGRDRTLFLKGYVADPAQIEPLLAGEGDAISGRSKVRFVLVIPRGFERDILAGETPTVQALFDAADSNTAGVTNGFLSAAVGAQNARLMTETVGRRHGADFT